MGFLDKAKEQLTKAVDQHGDKIEKGADKLAGTINDKTDHQHADKTDGCIDHPRRYPRDGAVRELAMQVVSVDVAAPPNDSPLLRAKFLRDLLDGAVVALDYDPRQPLDKGRAEKERKEREQKEREEKERKAREGK